MNLALVEPLRFLFKDEVRLVGEALGLPEKLVWRQPFPGPGLTVRCLGEVTKPRVSRLRKADAILLEELSNIGMIGKGAETSQAFAVLLPVRSVGVMGDGRTYEEVIALRSVDTSDCATSGILPTTRHIAAAEEMIIAQKSKITSFAPDNGQDLLLAGEVALGVERHFAVGIAELHRRDRGVLEEVLEGNTLGEPIEEDKSYADHHCPICNNKAIAWMRYAKTY